MILLKVFILCVLSSIHATKYRTIPLMHSFVQPFRFHRQVNPVNLESVPSNEPTKPTQPIQTMQPMQPMQPIQPIHSVQPIKDSEPLQILTVDNKVNQNATRNMISFDNVDSALSLAVRLSHLANKNVNRSSLSSSHMETLEKLMLQYEKQLPHDFIPLSYGMQAMCFRKTDFSNEVNECLQRIAAIHFKNIPENLYRYVRWLNNMLYTIDPSVLPVVNEAIPIVMGDKNVKFGNLIQRLGRVGVFWSSLSSTATDELQMKLYREIVKMNEKEFNQLLIDLRFMKVTFDKLHIIGSILLQTIEKYASKCDSRQLLSILGNIKIPFILLSDQLQEYIVKIFKEQYVHYHYALSDLNGMRIGECMPQVIKSFLCNEVILNIVNKSDQLSRQLVLLRNLGIKWSDIPATNQAMLINAIIKYLPQYSDLNRYFLIEALFMMIPEYKTLPLLLQQEIQNKLIKELPSNISTGTYCVLIDRMSKIGLQVTDMNDKLSKVLKKSLNDRLHVMSDSNVNVVLSAFAVMGLTL